MFCTIIKHLPCLSKAEFCWLDQSEKVPFAAPWANQSVMGFSSGFLPQHLPEVQVGPTTMMLMEGGTSLYPEDFMQD